MIKRGKAGAELEVGNSLFLAESVDGYILDHELKREKSPGDSRWLQERYEGLKEKCNPQLYGLAADRGFASKAFTKKLEEDNVYDSICPRDAKKLAKRLEEDEIFYDNLVRRAQTEGRIGILKNVFLGGTPLSKGFKNRQRQVAWAVLSHNLWVLARQKWREEPDAVVKAA